MSPPDTTSARTLYESAEERFGAAQRLLGHYPSSAAGMLVGAGVQGARLVVQLRTGADSDQLRGEDLVTRLRSADPEPAAALAELLRHGDYADGAAVPSGGELAAMNRNAETLVTLARHLYVASANPRTLRREVDKNKNVIPMCEFPACVLAADHVDRGERHAIARVSGLACPHNVPNFGPGCPVCD